MQQHTTGLEALAREDGSDKYSNTVKVLAEMVGDITENELLCMLEETVPPGFGH